MTSGKYSALSGAIARDQAIAHISANLANVSTTGYKRRGLSFEAMLRGEQQTNKAKGINYSRVKTVNTDFSPGPLKHTENPFDVAIHGEGFFKVQGPNGALYTRRGDFVTDQAGILRTSNGMMVLDNGGGPITIPNADTSQVSIGESGIVAIVNADGGADEVGQVAVVGIDNLRNLRQEENTMYSLGEGAAETELATPFRLVQGSLETANVNMTEEMTNLIDNYRAYENYHKVIESYKALGEQQDALGTLS
ncbi:MAG: flagellar basal-body rod protein FlgF [Desulfobulbaceae bacterium]|nr:flagellar basal-body rod protein FlgF [Desulfobulbaceae bacterium]